MLGDFYHTGKIQRLRPGLNPRIGVPEASMLTTRPPKPSNWGLMSEIFFFKHCSNHWNIQKIFIGKDTEGNGILLKQNTLPQHLSTSTDENLGHTHEVKRIFPYFKLIFRRFHLSFFNTVVWQLVSHHYTTIWRMLTDYTTFNGAAAAVVTNMRHTASKNVLRPRIAHLILV